MAILRLAENSPRNFGRFDLEGSHRALSRGRRDFREA